MNGVVILLPTYNERENIRDLIPSLFALLPGVRIMVIDDTSPDGTGTAVKEMERYFPGLTLYAREKKEGLGRAYADAFEKILRDPGVQTIVTMDADHSHDPADLRALLSHRDRYDVVVGSRYVPGGRIEGWEYSRRLLSAWGNRYARLVTRVPILDVTSGFNCLSADVLRRIPLSTLDSSGYAFTIATKYALWKAGASMAEVPITFKSRRSGESKISLRIVAEGMLLPWQLRRRAFSSGR